MTLTQKKNTTLPLTHFRFWDGVSRLKSTQDQPILDQKIKVEQRIALSAQQALCDHVVIGKTGKKDDYTMFLLSDDTTRDRSKPCAGILSSSLPEPEQIDPKELLEQSNNPRIVNLRQIYEQIEPKANKALLSDMWRIAALLDAGDKQKIATYMDWDYGYASHQLDMKGFNDRKELDDLTDLLPTEQRPDKNKVLGFDDLSDEEKLDFKKNVVRAYQNYKQNMQKTLDNLKQEQQNSVLFLALQNYGHRSVLKKDYDKSKFFINIRPDLSMNNDFILGGIYNKKIMQEITDHMIERLYKSLYKVEFPLTIEFDPRKKIHPQTDTDIPQKALQIRLMMQSEQKNSSCFDRVHDDSFSTPKKEPTEETCPDLVKFVLNATGPCLFSFSCTKSQDGYYFHSIPTEQEKRIVGSQLASTNKQTDLSWLKS